MRAFGEIEGIAAAAGLDRLVIGAQRAAAALLVDRIEPALELEAAKVVDEEADAAELAAVAGVFGNAVAVAIDRVVVISL